MRINFNIALAALMLSGCVYGPRVETPEAAIGVAKKACTTVRQTDSSDWKAKADGDHWKVWMGDEKNPVLTVNVARNGRRPDGKTECYFDVSF